MPHKLHVIVASTRPGRIGSTVGKWIYEQAVKQGAFEVRLVELAELNLPVYDEPHHPRLRKYEHEHTKRWSAIVEGADAFSIVTPEYNYGMPPSLLNAFEYVFHEWAYKPVGFVSYGGVSGGLRSVQMAKMVATTLRMMPIPDGVPIPFVMQHVKEGVFEGTDVHAKSLDAMLVELSRWAGALASLRAPRP
ncbi:MAG TPA: NAD(P)H-dependent oxidoreductase [Polyangiaceae bacterium]|nr:NAD(P)H-dependent oxidoreductase [Polyangiaceae bacterium]